MLINPIIQTNQFHSPATLWVTKNNIQYKNIHQSDKKETNIGQSVEQIAFTNDLILQLESVTETTQADHTANIKAKGNHRSDKKSNNSSTSVISEKKEYCYSLWADGFAATWDTNRLYPFFPPKHKF